VGYPSQLKLLSLCIEKNSINQINPKNIFTTAEILDSNTRQLINSAFGVEVVDLFGCIEVNRTAWECSEHCGYHLDVDSVITEFIHEKENVSAGEKGNIVYTSLYNYAMPLIRYEVGDVGIPSDELCSCGRCLPLMKSIEGRHDDFIVLQNGKLVSPRVLSLIIKHTDGIIEYQLIQESLCSVVMFVKISTNIQEKYIHELKQKIENSLDNEVVVEIKVVDEIKRGLTGKVRSIISCVK